MKRLLKDAERLTGKKYELSSYADIVEAIHAIQTEMGITGTTQEEAEKTISGSLSRLKSAWQNFLTAMGEGDEIKLDKLGDELIESIGKVMDNVIPVAKNVLIGIVHLAEQMLPGLVPYINGLITGFLPDFMGAIGSLIGAVIKNLPQMIKTLFFAVGTLVENALANLVTVEGRNLRGHLHKTGITVFGVLNPIKGMILDFVKTLSNLWKYGIGPIIQNVAVLLDDELLPAVGDFFNKLRKIIGKGSKDAEKPFRGVWVLFHETIWPLLRGFVDFFKNTIAPAILNTVEFIVDKVVPVLVENKEVILGIIGGIGAAIAASKIAKKIKDVMGTVKGLFAVVKAHPFMLIIAAIGAVIGYIVHLYKTNNKAKVAIDKAFRDIKRFWEKTLKPTFENIRNFVTKTLVPEVVKKWDEFKDAAGDAFGKVKEFWDKTLTPAFENGAKFIEDQLVPALGELVDWFGEIAEKVGAQDWEGVGSLIWDGIKRGFNVVNGWLLQLLLGDDYTPESGWGDVGAKIWKAIKDGFNVVSGWLIKLILGDEYTPESDWGDVGAKIWKAIKDGFNVVNSWLLRLVLGDDYTPESGWGEAGAKIWEAIKDGFNVVNGWLLKLLLGDDYTPESGWGDVGAKIWEAIKDGFNVVSGWLLQLVLGDEYTPESGWSDAGAKIWDKIVAGLSPAAKWLKELLDSWAAKLSDGSIDFGEIGRKVGSIIFGAIKTAFNGIIGWFKKLFWGESDEDKDSVKGSILSNDWEGLGESIINLIGTAFIGVAEFFKGYFQEAWDAIEDLDWAGLGELMWGAISGAFGNVVNWLSGVFRDAINAIIDAANDLIDKVNERFGFLGFKLNYIDYIHEKIYSGGAGREKIPGAGRANKRSAKGGKLYPGQTSVVGEYEPEMLRMVGNTAVVTPLSGGRWGDNDNTSAIFQDGISSVLNSINAINHSINSQTAATNSAVQSSREAGNSVKAALNDSSLMMATYMKALLQAFDRVVSMGNDKSAVLEVDGVQFGRVVFNAYRKEASRIGVNIAGGGYA